jgi:NNP family nitrate/nitrite transporter-like MFS transporter
MTEVATSKSHKMLFFNTLAFTICFAAWMLNGVLVTFLVSNEVFDWSRVEIGWLIGIPVLTGALARFPVGILTDKFGGKWVYGILLLLSAIPMYLLSTATTFNEYALYSLGFGITGASFAVGIAFTSIWYPKKNQGTVLGIFGAGNAGAALTTLLAPTILNNLTDNGANLEGWRELPIYYAIMLLVMGIIFLIFTENKTTSAADKTLAKMILPLKDVQVWKFGLWYFLVFGCFVAFSQWLVPYFVNVYYLPLVTAGLFAAAFSFPSGVIRAFGGWLSDVYGGRKVMIWVLASSIIISAMLLIPKVDIYSPGEGVTAKIPGVVTKVTQNTITVGKRVYHYSPKDADDHISIIDSDKMIIFPEKKTWQEAVVKVGDEIQKKQLLAKGTTRISFQANVWIFAFLAILIGAIWGIGKAGVYKYIPEHYPDNVGMVGGIVGVLGGLGGFFTPIIFGYLLEWTGLWSSAWAFMLLLSLISMWWILKDIEKTKDKREHE